MSAANEKVMCFPSTLLTKLGEPSGFDTNASKYLQAILASNDIRFIDRSEAESDPSWKQIIPYQVVRTSSDLFFTYRRGSKGGEDRLKKRRSLGIGGHINEDDIIIKNDHSVTFHTGRLRELDEEVSLGQHADHRLTGVIYDPSTAVGSVHFGFCYHIYVGEPKLHVKDEAIVEHSWATLEELKNERSEFESWSQIVIEELLRSNV